MATEMHAALSEETGSHSFDIGNIYDEILSIYFHCGAHEGVIVQVAVSEMLYFLFNLIVYL